MGRFTNHPTIHKQTQKPASTHVVDLVEADERLEEAKVGPRQPVPQQVALPAQHRLGVVCGVVHLGLCGGCVHEP